MIVRSKQNDIQQALRRQAAVVLLGPRQVGKTTLALTIAETKDAVYLDLQDPVDRSKLVNARLFLENTQDQLVILDEIHRMPDLFETLRGVIDRARRRGKGKGRFLILGSAAVDLLKQSESLAGRVAYIELSPIIVSEIGQLQIETRQLWLRGGFPDSYLAESDEDSMLLRKDFIRTYLERDIPMFGPRVPSTTMVRLWTMLAHHQGALLNASKFGRSLDVSTQSVGRYIDLLSDLLLVRRLPPMHKNVGKRLVKRPKLYIRDSGLLHSLLGIETFESLLGHPVVGASWEGFVIEQVLSTVGPNVQASFYRTSAGAEMDLILDYPDGRRTAIEIKRGLRTKPTKGFYNAYDDVQPDAAFIIHGGEDRFPITEGAEAVGLLEFIHDLTN